MKISIFTPTHKLDHIKRLAKSIENQTYKDFEWVVMPNGDITVDDVKNLLSHIPQLVVVPYKGESNKIGEIKNYICHQCTGYALAEVDHDDELTPDCMEEVAKAFKETDADFVCSYSANVKGGKQPFIYDRACGWEYKPFMWNGHDVKQCIGFEPSPAAFSKIWWAPNHIRVWKAEFYRDIGGHNKELPAVDDHELMARTYIKGSVHQIEKCLYIYHIHQNNSWASNDLNSFIQSETKNIHDKYILDMVAKWSDINGLKKINLGWIDSNPKCEIFKIEDAIDGKFPFEDGSVGLFRAVNELQRHEAIPVMKEVYRCLAPNGWFLTDTPSTDGRGAFMNPTYKSFWNENSFWFYTKKGNANLIGKPVKFQTQRINNYFPSDWHRQHQIKHVKADLLKFSGRVPGRVHI
jgi:glycosyltransferase involved in cell wall biosynthesis